MKQKTERKSRARSSVATKEKPGPSNKNRKKTAINKKKKAPPKETHIHEPVTNDVKKNGRKRKADKSSKKVEEKKQKIQSKNVTPAKESSAAEETVERKVSTKRRVKKTKEMKDAPQAKKAKKFDAKKTTKTVVKRKKGTCTGLPKMTKEVKKAPQSKKAKEVQRKKTTKTVVKRRKGALEVPKLPSISGTLFVLGNNEAGQLGLDVEDVLFKKRPTENPVNVKFVDVAAGGMHSLCLTDNGRIYTFGCNDEGALGRRTDGNEELEQTPTMIDLSDVVKISAGDCHSAALTKNGKVYIWGAFRDNTGIIGLTPTVIKGTSSEPLQILEDVQIVDIASGCAHMVCLSNKGKVYTFGCGEIGQLGRITEPASTGTQSNETLVDWLEPKVVRTGQRGRPFAISNIWTGGNVTFMEVRTRGTMCGFGLNNYYQLGLPLQLREGGEEVEGPCVQYTPVEIDSFSKDVGWRCITGGQHHTLALDNNGLVHVLGQKEYGRLGLGQNCDHAQIPTLVPALAQQNCIHISGGGQTSFSITDNGTLYSWGFGTCYQLGHGHDEDVLVPQIVEGRFGSIWNVLKVSGGGQHTLILANQKEITPEED